MSLTSTTLQIDFDVCSGDLMTGAREKHFRWCSKAVCQQMSGTTVLQWLTEFIQYPIQVQYQMCAINRY